MKQHTRTLGWLSLAAAFIWIWYDYQNRIREAIIAGWATIVLAVAHIAAAKQ